MMPSHVAKQITHITKAVRKGIKDGEQTELAVLVLALTTALELLNEYAVGEDKLATDYELERREKNG